MDAAALTSRFPATQDLAGKDMPTFRVAGSDLLAVVRTLRDEQGFDLLDAPAIGMTLTESFAMWPPASVSGFYFSHPESRYFATGFSYGGSIYSSNPANRSLIIDGRLYREGEQVTPDVKLETIKPKGAVLLFRGYRYTLRPGAFRTGDPLAEFLFEKKAGYCEYFASAAVVLLGLAVGLAGMINPTRVVTLVIAVNHFARAQ